MYLTSVNVGSAEPIKVGNDSIQTGIYKRASLNSVVVTERGLEGDVTVDKDRHGGVDQAVYLYSQEDYHWWSRELGRDLPAGTFGENLTVSSFGEQPLRIGDRFQISDVLLEVTFGRVPCATLGARMNDAGFVKRFVNSQRPGVYARVLKPGTVKVADFLTLTRAAKDYPTVNELYELFHAKDRDPKLLEKGLKAPIAERARLAFEYWLEMST